MAKPSDVPLKLLANALADSSTIQETVDHVVRFAVETLGTSFGAVTLLYEDGNRLETVGSTHQSVIEADILQYELREGPCLDASVNAKSVVSGDFRADPRWPRWAPRAAGLGFRSILATEMHGRGQRIGSLNLYWSNTREFTPDDVEVAHIFAQQAAVALASARSEEGMRLALDSRMMIGQAQGILMERFAIGAAQAFSILRRYSQNTNIKLRDVAKQIIATRRLPEDPTEDGEVSNEL